MTKQLSLKIQVPPVEALLLTDKNLAKKKSFIKLNSWYLNKPECTLPKTSVIYFTVLIGCTISQYEILAESLF